MSVATQDIPPKEQAVPSTEVKGSTVTGQVNDSLSTVPMSSPQNNPAEVSSNQTPKATDPASSIGVTTDLPNTNEAVPEAVVRNETAGNIEAEIQEAIKETSGPGAEETDKKVDEPPGKEDSVPQPLEQSPELVKTDIKPLEEIPKPEVVDNTQNLDTTTDKHTVSEETKKPELLENSLNSDSPTEKLTATAETQKPEVLETTQNLDSPTDKPAATVETPTPSENEATKETSERNTESETSSAPPEETNEASSETQTTEQNKKALELLTTVDGNEEAAEPKELDIKELSSQVLSILNDGKSDDNLTNDELKQKSIDLQDFITQMIGILKDKTDLCAGLDRQNAALIHQAKSLKNVIAITKDLLSIRNMEVEHLHADLKILEESVSAERTRHDLLLKKLSEALSLNDQLKTEYHNQHGLFESLREKYNEKIVLLTTENNRLKSLVYKSNEIKEPDEQSSTESIINEVVEK